MATYTVTGAVAGVPLGVKPQIVEVVLEQPGLRIAK